MRHTALIADHPLMAAPETTPVINSGPTQPPPGLIAIDGIGRSWSDHHRWSTELRSTSLLSSNVHAACLDRWLATLAFTGISGFLDDVAQIWVVPVCTRPTELVGDFDELLRPFQSESLSPAKRALAAVLDVQTWLEIGRDDVAHLAGYSPRSIRNWQAGMDPYPATVRRLYDIHALVGSLEQRLGSAGARVWLSDTTTAGRTRRDLLGEEGGLQILISEASTILFEQPARDFRDVAFEEYDPPENAPRPELFTDPVRRVRRRR